jgi:hypothetical protein
MSREKRSRPLSGKETVPTKKVKLASRSKSAPTKQSKQLKAKIPDQYKETESDSDPIIESDTGEESGEDGVSWPSDQDNEGFEDGMEEEEGGVELPKEAKQTATDEKNTASQTNKSCMFSIPYDRVKY